MTALAIAIALVIGAFLVAKVAGRRVQTSRAALCGMVIVLLVSAMSATVEASDSLNVILRALALLVALMSVSLVLVDYLRRPDTSDQPSEAPKAD